MRKTRRRFLAAVGASIAIAGCQDDGAGPTPGSPGVGDTPGAGGEESPADGDGVGEGTETDGMEETETDGTGEETETDGTGEETETDGMGEETETDGAGDGTETDGMGEATVQVAEHDEYGAILVDSEGMTLYVFTNDSQGAGESTCTDDCATNWPPLTVADDEPMAGDGVEAELSTFERGDGDTQVAANGWPLYYFADDTGEGDANGQGINDAWFVVDPSGEAIVGDGGDGTGTETEAA